MRALRVFRRVFRYYRRYKTATILGSLCVAASGLVVLQAPRLVRRAIDLLQAGAPLGGVARLAGLIVLIAAVAGLFLFAQRRILVGVSRHIEHDLRTDLYSHLLRLPAAYFVNQRVGDLLTRAVSDVGTVRSAVGPAWMYALNTVVVLIAGTILMSRIHPGLTVLALMILPLVAGVTRFFGTRIHRRWGQAQEQLSTLTARVQEHLVGLRVLRAFTCEETENARMADLSRDYLQVNARLIRLQSLFHPLLHLLIGTASVLVLAAGGTLVREGRITLGQFVEFNLYLVRLVWPMIAVGWVANLVQRGVASMERIEELFSQPAQIDPAATGDGAVPAKPAAIEVVNASFTYPGGTRPAIAEVSFSARPGERVAVVGTVGSGKSTLLTLIPRLIELDHGEILLDSLPVNRQPLDRIRAQIALVPQGSFLFSATLRDNIALARPEATNEEILQAAAAAGLAADLERFPAGLDTVVGERGVTLSGGQRQRVSIARALLTRPRVLLLDDCLSAVDTATERAILRSLPGTTLVFATHRLAAAELCDQVLVLESGQVVEAGSPGDLAGRGGLYARLLTLQRLADPHSLAVSG